MLREIVLDNTSLYDILNATVDESLMKGVAESMIKFSDTNKIVLYTSLNKTNTELLKQGKYKNTIKSFEYVEMAMGIGQSEYIIELIYDITKMFDSLHPLAYTEIEKIIQENKLKKSEIKDKEIIQYLITRYNYTGVRMHIINSSKKCYPETHTIFSNSKLVYILKPQDVQISRILDKNTKEVVWDAQRDIEEQSKPTQLKDKKTNK